MTEKIDVEALKAKVARACERAIKTFAPQDWAEQAVKDIEASLTGMVRKRMGLRKSFGGWELSAHYGVVSDAVTEAAQLGAKALADQLHLVERVKLNAAQKKQVRKAYRAELARAACAAAREAAHEAARRIADGVLAEYGLGKEASDGD